MSDTRYRPGENVYINVLRAFGDHIMRTSIIAISAVFALTVIGCDEPAPSPPSDESDGDVDYRWLPDDDAEKFSAIENQFGGFSETMHSVGHRYTELYWAGRDRNWQFADYQLEKINDSIERGIIRRPARAESARDFLDGDIAPLQETIDAEDGDAFDEQFDDFTAACNTCHAKEEVPFINIDAPEHRLSPVQPLERE